MIVDVKGLKRVKFHDDERDEDVDGITCHCEYFDPDVVGKSTKPIFLKTYVLESLGFPIPDARYPDFIGRKLDIEFNQKKGIIGIAFAD